MELNRIPKGVSERFRTIGGTPPRPPELAGCETSTVENSPVGKETQSRSRPQRAVTHLLSTPALRHHQGDGTQIRRQSVSQDHRRHPRQSRLPPLMNARLDSLPHRGGRCRNAQCFAGSLDLLRDVTIPAAPGPASRYPGPREGEKKQRRSVWESAVQSLFFFSPPCVPLNERRSQRAAERARFIFWGRVFARRLA